MQVSSASRARLRLIYPDVARRFKLLSDEFHVEHSLTPQVAQGVRPYAYQAKLYEQGRTTPGKIVTYARAGESLHNFALAFDICFDGKYPYLENLPETEAEKLWLEAGRIGKKFGLTWGGDWPGKKRDLGHFECVYGLSLEEIQRLYEEGGIERVWSRIDFIRGVPLGQEWMGPQEMHELIGRGIL